MKSSRHSGLLNSSLQAKLPKSQQMKNFMSLKAKIIHTDELIRRYQEKARDSEGYRRQLKEVQQRLSSVEQSMVGLQAELQAVHEENGMLKASLVETHQDLDASNNSKAAQEMIVKQLTAQLRQLHYQRQKSCDKERVSIKEEKERIQRQYKLLKREFEIYKQAHSDCDIKPMKPSTRRRRNSTASTCSSVATLTSPSYPPSSSSWTGVWEKSPSSLSSLHSPCVPYSSSGRVLLDELLESNEEMEHGECPIELEVLYEGVAEPVPATEEEEKVESHAGHNNAAFADDDKKPELVTLEQESNVATDSDVSECKRASSCEAPLPFVPPQAEGDGGEGERDSDLDLSCSDTSSECSDSSLSSVDDMLADYLNNNPDSESKEARPSLQEIMPPSNHPEPHRASLQVIMPPSDHLEPHRASLQEIIPPSNHPEPHRASLQEIMPPSDHPEPHRASLQEIMPSSNHPEPHRASLQEIMPPSNHPEPHRASLQEIMPPSDYPEPHRASLQEIMPPSDHPEPHRASLQEIMPPSDHPEPHRASLQEIMPPSDHPEPHRASLQEIMPSSDYPEPHRASLQEIMPPSNHPEPHRASLQEIMPPSNHPEPHRARSASMPVLDHSEPHTEASLDYPHSRRESAMIEDKWESSNHVRPEVEEVSSQQQQGERLASLTHPCSGSTRTEEENENSPSDKESPLRCEQNSGIESPDGLHQHGSNAMSQFVPPFAQVPRLDRPDGPDRPDLSTPISVSLEGAQKMVEIAGNAEMLPVGKEKLSCVKIERQPNHFCGAEAYRNTPAENDYPLVPTSSKRSGNSVPERTSHKHSPLRNPPSPPPLISIVPDMASSEESVDSDFEMSLSEMFATLAALPVSPHARFLTLSPLPPSPNPPRDPVVLTTISPLPPSPNPPRDPVVLTTISPLPSSPIHTHNLTSPLSPFSPSSLQQPLSPLPQTPVCTKKRRKKKKPLPLQFADQAPQGLCTPKPCQAITLPGASPTQPCPARKTLRLSESSPFSPPRVFSPQQSCFDLVTGSSGSGEKPTILAEGYVPQPNQVVASEICVREMIEEFTLTRESSGKAVDGDGDSKLDLLCEECHKVQSTSAASKVSKDGWKQSPLPGISKSDLLGSENTELPTSALSANENEDTVFTDSKLRANKPNQPLPVSETCSETETVEEMAGVQDHHSRVPFSPSSDEKEAASDEHNHDHPDASPSTAEHPKEEEEELEDGEIVESDESRQSSAIVEPIAPLPPRMKPPYHVRRDRRCSNLTPPTMGMTGFDWLLNSFNKGVPSQAVAKTVANPNQSKPKPPPPLTLPLPPSPRSATLLTEPHTQLAPPSKRAKGNPVPEAPLLSPLPLQATPLWTLPGYQLRSRQVQFSPHNHNRKRKLSRDDEDGFPPPEKIQKPTPTASTQTTTTTQHHTHSPERTALRQTESTLRLQEGEVVRQTEGERTVRPQEGEGVRQTEGERTVRPQEGEGEVVRPTEGERTVKLHEEERGVVRQMEREGILRSPEREKAAMRQSEEAVALEGERKMVRRSEGEKVAVRQQVRERTAARLSERGIAAARRKTDGATGQEEDQTPLNSPRETEKTAEDAKTMKAKGTGNSSTSVAGPSSSSMPALGYGPPVMQSQGAASSSGLSSSSSTDQTTGRSSDRSQLVDHPQAPSTNSLTVASSSGYLSTVNAIGGDHSETDFDRLISQPPPALRDTMKHSPLPPSCSHPPPHPGLSIAQQQLTETMRCPLPLPAWLVNQMAKVQLEVAHTQSTISSGLRNRKKARPYVPIKRQRRQNTMDYMVVNLERLACGFLHLSTAVSMFSDPWNVSCPSELSIAVVKFFREFYHPQMEHVVSLYHTLCNTVRAHSRQLQPLDSSFPPPLTKPECQLVALFAHVCRMNSRMGNFLPELMNALHQAIITPGSKFHTLSAMCRIFTALCRLQGDSERVQFLCWDLLRRPLLPNELPVIASIASTWPATLARKQGTRILEGNRILAQGLEQQPLSFTLEAITVAMVRKHKDKGMDNMLKNLHTLCNWRQSFNPSTLNDLTRCLMVILQNSEHVYIDAPSTQGAWRRPRPSALAFRVVHCLRILAWYQGWMWTNDTLIRTHLWPLLQQWNGRNGESVREATVVCVIRLIGFISQQGLSIDPQSSSIQQLQRVLLALLHGGSTPREVVLPVQLAAADSLLELAPPGHPRAREAVTSLTRWIQGLAKQPAGPILTKEFYGRLQPYGFLVPHK